MKRRAHAFDRADTIDMARRDRLMAAPAPDALPDRGKDSLLVSEAGRLKQYGAPDTASFCTGPRRCAAGEETRPTASAHLPR